MTDIRVTTAEDIEELAYLSVRSFGTYLDWFPEHSPSTREDWIHTWTRRQNRGMTLAIGEKPMLAFLYFTQALRPEIEEEESIPGLAHIGTLAVHPQHQRKNLATRLLEESFMRMQAQSYTACQLWTPKDYAPSRNLYEKMGFVATGDETYMEDPKLEVVQYQRSL